MHTRFSSSWARYAARSSGLTAVPVIQGSAAVVTIATLRPPSRNVLRPSSAARRRRRLSACRVCLCERSNHGIGARTSHVVEAYRSSDTTHKHSIRCRGQSMQNGMAWCDNSEGVRHDQGCSDRTCYVQQNAEKSDSAVGTCARSAVLCSSRDRPPGSPSACPTAVTSRAVSAASGDHDAASAAASVSGASTEVLVADGGARSVELVVKRLPDTPWAAVGLTAAAPPAAVSRGRAAGRLCCR